MLPDIPQRHPQTVPVKYSSHGCHLPVGVWFIHLFKGFWSTGMVFCWLFFWHCKWLVQGNETSVSRTESSALATEYWLLLDKVTSVSVWYVLQLVKSWLRLPTRWFQPGTVTINACRVVIIITSKKMLLIPPPVAASAVQARCDSPSLSSAPSSRLPRRILRANLWSSWSPVSAICQTSLTVSSTSSPRHLRDSCFFCSRTNSLEFTARLSEGSSCRLRTV